MFIQSIQRVLSQIELVVTDDCDWIRQDLDNPLKNSPLIFEISGRQIRLISSETPLLKSSQLHYKV